MNMEITRETRILAEVSRQSEPARKWMLDAIAELGNAPNGNSVMPEHVSTLLSRHPDKKSFEEGAERYVKYHVYPTVPDSDKTAFQARMDAAQACVKLEKIIYR